MGSQHLRLGRRGEAAVARWYRRRGYRVVARNWRSPEGELDLVLSRGRLVVFCEVKTRSSRRHGMPVEAVDEAKHRRIRLLGRRFLATQDLAGIAHRFDVAEVLGADVAVRQGVL